MNKHCIFFLFAAGVLSDSVTFAQPVALSANSNTMVASAPDSRGWTDPALNHNRLLTERVGEGVFIQVGTYKVKGSPYLFGGKHEADLFTPTEKAYNIKIGYNTYNQEIEFYSTSNPATALTKETGDVDSFTLKIKENPAIPRDLKFIYGPLLGSSDKSYLQVVESGQRYSLYKRYKSSLGYVSENYIQSELRQFELASDYFYYDAETKKLKKLKQNLSDLTKEFKSIKDISTMTNRDAYASNPEAVMKTIFQFLNK
ncbi:MAG TPA: hypothetical protein VFX58_16715 [Chitinophagaceae bacterium]|nr:hypothetical protein [Chitinophagaceae bacterium]